eukprot:1190835-Prorocentrum_minimum.AAC.1
MRCTHMYGLQQAPQHCTLCQHEEGRENVVSDVIHTYWRGARVRRLESCIVYDMHDQTVDRVFNSVMKGNRGAATVLHDTGKYQDMDDNVYVGIL